MLTNHVWLRVLLLSQVQCFASHQLHYEDAIFVVIRGEYVSINISTNVSLREYLFVYRKKKTLFRFRNWNSLGMVASRRMSNNWDCGLCKRRDKSEASRVRSREGCGLWGIKTEGNHKDFLGTENPFYDWNLFALLQYRTLFSSLSNL